MRFPMSLKVCLSHYLWFCLTLSCCCEALVAQTSIPVGNAVQQVQSPSVKLEVEQIEIGKMTALPPAIHRHAGKFLLLVSDPRRFALSFVITKVASDSATNTTPLVTIDRRYPVVAHKQAALIDLPSGQYEMKLSATGQVFCSFTID